MSFDNLPFRRDGAVAALFLIRAQVFDTFSFPRIDEPLQVAVSYSGGGADVSQWNTVRGHVFESGQ